MMINKVCRFTIDNRRSTIDGASRLALLLLVVSLLALSCAQKGEDCTINVTVVEKATGKPLAGAEVLVDGKTIGMSDAGGLCRGSVKLSYGKHGLCCRKEGFTKTEWTMELSPQEGGDEKGFEGEASLLDEIGDLEAEFDYRIEMSREE